MKKISTLLIAILMSGVLPGLAQVKFPDSQPGNGNFNRPIPDQVLDVSPPGFCWWRAADRGEADYRLRIENKSGKQVYQSGILADPVHVPDEVLPAGDYTWFVDAVDKDGKILATRDAQHFSISEGSFELPWVDPAELLKKVPENHPRLLFPGNKLVEVRASLSSTRKDAYEDVRKLADDAMKLELMDKPDFDRFDRETEFPARRTAYRASYHEFGRIYNRGMVPLALMYQLSGEEKYGLKAKEHLLNLLDWEIDGVASLELSFDEIGLKIARTAAQGYDWLYDLFTDDEREAVKQMLLARGDQMLERIEGRDFLFKSAYSHDGRLPGYMVEFAIVLAEEERAIAWMDYAMRALMTVFPHWGGIDGGWAEGMNYVLSYNDRFITPLQSLYEATGFNLWNKAYFRNMRHFPVYCASPIGEITPFGDSEHHSIRSRSGEMYSILFFHSLLYNDGGTRWWIEQLDVDDDGSDRFGAMHRILNEDVLKPERPDEMENDRIFRGIGWAALHSDILNPKEDLMVLFKSSPYGPVSHSHADQNSFAILKGGKALANPSGARYPQHMSPFHFQYSNLTIAHNALLINGEGQIDRDGSANGSLVDFKSTDHLALVSGDAQKCYGDRVSRYHRHMILIRPNIILVIDDLKGEKPLTVEWLMHCREEMKLNNKKQIIESTRMGEKMKTSIFSKGGMEFSLTNEWPIDPKQDYPMVTAEPPAKEWHFSGKLSDKSKRQRILAVMQVAENDKYPEIKITREDNEIFMKGQTPEGSWSARVNLDTSAPVSILELEFVPSEGKAENLLISE